MTDLDRCVANVATELSLDKKDVQEIADRLKAERARLSADSQITNADEALKKFAGAEAEKIRIGAALARKQAALTIIINDEMRQHVSTMTSQGMRLDKAIESYLTGTSRGVSLGRKSVMARRGALEGKFIGGLLKDMLSDPDTAHVVKLLRTARKDEPVFQNIVREMYELREGGKPGKTGDVAAQKVAKLYATYAEASRLEANQAGANVGRLDGWAGPQAHDARKVLKAGEAKWTADIAAELDVERTTGGDPENLAALLHAAHDDITMGRDPAMSAAAKGDFSGPANLARSLGKHRVLHFKDADAWLRYNEKYGRGHVGTGMLDHLHSVARTMSLLQTLGPNPRAFLDAFIKNRASELRNVDTKAGKKAYDVLRRTDLDKPGADFGISNAFAQVSGSLNIPHGPTLAKIGSDIRSAESLAKLGSAILSSAGDLGTFAQRMRFQGVNIFGGYAKAFQSLVKRPDGDRTALMLNVFYDSILGDIHSRFSAEDSLPGTLSRWTTAFFKASGLTGWTDRLTNGFAHMASAWMAEHAHLPLAELPDAYRHVLAIHGLDGPRWDVARQALYTAEDGKRFIMPEVVRSLPMEAFAPLARDGTPRQLERAQRELELDLRSFFADEASYGVLKADDRTRMFTTAGLQKGTTLGEIVRFAMQFKGYPIAYVQRVIKPAWHGGPGGKPDVMAIGQMLAAMTLFGYASMTAKDFIKNKTYRDPTDRKTILAAMAQGGALGIYGDFLFGATDRMGNATALETAAGPFFGTVNNFLKLYTDIRDGRKVAGDAFYFALNQAPWINLWFSRAILDLAFLNGIQEHMSPGTFKRRASDMKRDYGQSYITPPLSHSLIGPTH